MAEQLDMWTSSPAGFPVRTSAAQAAAPDSTEPDPGCGSKCDESCARCGPFGSLLKTSLLFELGALTGSCLTWKRSASPAGRSWWVLDISEQPTDAIESGSSGDDWPTPTATSYGSSNNGCPGDGREEYATKGKPSLEGMANQWPTPRASLNEQRQTKPSPSQLRGEHGMNLAAAVNWPTPRAEDCEQTGAHRGAPDTLTSAMRLWPTATAGDSRSSGSRTTEGSAAHPGISLTDAAVHGLKIDDTAKRWVTPTARDWKDSPGQESCVTDHQHCDLLPRQVFAGLQDPGSSSTDGKPLEPSLKLNADWVFQLMGYPRTWARLSTRPDLKLREIQSSLTSPELSDE